MIDEKEMERKDIRIYKNVEIGKNTKIGDFVIIGEPPVGKKDGELKTKIGSNCIIRAHTVIYAGTELGNKVVTGHGALVRENNKIGDNVSIGTNCVIEKDSVIENNVRLHSNVFIPDFTLIKEDAWIGPNVVLTNDPHPGCPKGKECMKGATIEKNARVGANVTIVPFVTIGENSLIGAGSVVTKDVPRNAVVVGNPARVVKDVCDLNCQFGIIEKPYGITDNPDSGKTEIPRAKPMVGEDERRAALKVLSSGQFVKGTEVENFEKEFAQYIGTKYAVAVNSGTTALALALEALDIKEGDEVIAPSNSFVATGSVISTTGATPVFVDINEKTFNIDPTKIEEKITDKTKAIIPVHLFGHPADMVKIMKIAKKHNIAVVEDAAQAHGAVECNGKKVGTFGDASCFSFFPTKNMMVGGDGGMIVTNNKKLAEKVIMLRDAGRKTRDKIEIFGYNYRLGEIQAAIGRVQLKKVDEWNEKRRKLAQHYNKMLKDVKEIETPVETDGVKHVYHLYTIKAQKRDKLKEALSAKSIKTDIMYLIPIHLQKAFVDKYGFKEGMLPITEKCSKEVLSLPMFPGLTEKEVEYVSNEIKNFYKKED